MVVLLSSSSGAWVEVNKSLWATKYRIWNMARKVEFEILSQLTSGALAHIEINNREILEKYSPYKKISI